MSSTNSSEAVDNPQGLGLRQSSGAFESQVKAAGDCPTPGGVRVPGVDNSLERLMLRHSRMQLHFHHFGTGAPLILLHGLFGSLDNWMPIARRLASEHTIYALDQRNHGLSPHDPQMDYPAMASDVKQFMDDHGLRRAHVLGHSMGGKTAMQLGALHPDRVDRLIVADIAPRGYAPAHDDLLESLSGLHLPSFEKRSEIEQWLEPAIPSLAVRRFLLKNLVRTPTGGFQWKFNLLALKENYPKLAGPPRIEQPCETTALFIRGGNSDYITVEDFETIRRLFPRSEMRDIPGASHWLHADAPDAFVAIVREFLNTASLAQQ